MVLDFRFGFGFGFGFGFSFGFGNALLKCVSLDLCGDETTFGHGGFGVCVGDQVLFELMWSLLEFLCQWGLSMWAGLCGSRQAQSLRDKNLLRRVSV